MNIISSVLEWTNIASPKTLAAGKHEIKYEFIIDEPKPGAGGKCILYVDGAESSGRKIPKTRTFIISADEG